ncbi:MAG: hypothetical protein ABW089_15210 [Sedimenticola sp.]
MKPVIQEETTGCAIASAAAVAGITYKAAKGVAKGIGIVASDQSLWSSTDPVRRLLRELGVEVDKIERPFNGWDRLPDCALLSIKWHLEDGRPFWHWVVFVREGARQYVLDSKKGLKCNLRTDFGRMKPKWYIGITDRR